MSIREQIAILESLSSLDQDILRINEQLKNLRPNSEDALTATMLDARIKATAEQNISPTLVAELESELKTRNEDRAKVVSKLPPALYRRYESIRVRRSIAIARTYDGTCLACHLALPPLLFQKMRRQEEFESCPNCRRILYYSPL